jgi:hypothetical protein
MHSAPQAELDRLLAACDQTAIKPIRPELLSLGDSATFAVGDSVIAKVTRFPGQQAVAHREVAISQWLAAVDLPAVVSIGDAVDQGPYTVTFWERLPEHRSATPAEIASYLVRLHATAAPSVPLLAGVQPFVRIAERIDASPLVDADKNFLRHRLADFEAQWPASTDLPTAIIHGDPHADNVVTTADGRVLILDLERFSLGPPEWDLALMASEYDSFRWITTEQYSDFATIYGYDVLKAPTYPLLRDIRELRMTTWLANKAGQGTSSRAETEHRIECLRGLHGPRPWIWAGG